MATIGYIATDELCSYHHIEYSFIDSLQQAGLVELRVIENSPHIDEHQLARLERMIRLHHELEINVAGIEAITHLLDRINDIQEQMRMVKNRLRRYEEG